MSEGRRIALNLITDLISGSLSVSDFCDAFERHFNFEWQGRNSDPLVKQFEVLFRCAAYFNPFEDERRSNPIYKSERQVLECAKATLALANA